MENNKVEKKNTGLIIILILIILGLVGYIVYDKVLVKIDDRDIIITDEIIKKDKSYSYADVAGYYSITKEFEFDGEKEQGKYMLYLYEDGTFKCEYSVRAITGYLGNYTIENNTIKLNYLFQSSSGTGLYVKSGSMIFDIIDNNSISCSSLLGYSKEIDFSGILIKSDLDEESIRHKFNKNGLYEILNDEADIFSEASRKKENELDN